MTDSAEQLFVGSHVGNPAIFEHDDLVGSHDRAQAVSDHKRRASLQQIGKTVLNQSLAFAVQVAGRFVEDQDPRIGNNR